MINSEDLIYDTLENFSKLNIFFDNLLDSISIQKNPDNIESFYFFPLINSFEEIILRKINNKNFYGLNDYFFNIRSIFIKIINKYSDYYFNNENKNKIDSNLTIYLDRIKKFLFNKKENKFNDFSNNYTNINCDANMIRFVFLIINENTIQNHKEILDYYVGNYLNFYIVYIYRII